MTTSYYTILMNHLEQMHIEVAAAAETELAFAAPKSRDATYDCNRFLFVREGRARLMVKDREVQLEPGTFCVLLTGVRHRIEVMPGESVRMQWCHFRASYGDRELFRALHIPFHVQFADGAEVGALFDRLMEEMARSRLTSRLRVKSIMLELISVYLEQLPADTGHTVSTQDLQKIEAVLQYIDEHLGDNLTVEELARLVYLHPNYFIVFFKGMLGLSPIQYVNNRRMEVAKSLLQKPEWSVSDIASRVGMQIYYFSRMFKAHTGLTPSRYRKQAIGVAPAEEIMEEERG